MVLVEKREINMEKSSELFKQKSELSKQIYDQIYGPEPVFPLVKKKAGA